MTAYKGNRTLDILDKAEKGGYGVYAEVCYDAGSVIGCVRAAERARSPCIIQLFPVTLLYGGGPFLKFCLDIAHSASVPISVHLDHATSAEHMEYALELAEKGISFDSIMCDASHADTDEENIAITKPYVERAEKLGIPVEVELGRLEGGEAGLRTISDAKLTDPNKAEIFIEGTGARILAPSIGNLHGRYLSAPNFRWQILEELKTKFHQKGTYLCMHGTDDLSDDFFRTMIACGVSKINMNSWARDPYMEHLSKSIAASRPLNEAIEEATEIFAQVSERFMHLFGSAGRA